MTRLLFDQNLSPKLSKDLSDLYFGSVHVDTLGLGSESDQKIWQLALDESYLIVTKDADFSELSVLRGVPPKVIWIRRGNCTTKAVETLLRKNSESILAFDKDPKLGVLTLF